MIKQLVAAALLAACGTPAQAEVFQLTFGGSVLEVSDTSLMQPDTYEVTITGDTDDFSTFLPVPVNGLQIWNSSNFDIAMSFDGSPAGVRDFGPSATMNGSIIVDQKVSPDSFDKIQISFAMFDNTGGFHELAAGLTLIANGSAGTPVDTGFTPSDSPLFPGAWDLGMYDQIDGRLNSVDTADPQWAVTVPEGSGGLTVEYLNFAYVPAPGATMAFCLGGLAAARRRRNA